MGEIENYKKFGQNKENLRKCIKCRQFSFMLKTLENYKKQENGENVENINLKNGKFRKISGENKECGGRH